MLTDGETRRADGRRVLQKSALIAVSLALLAIWAFAVGADSSSSGSESATESVVVDESGVGADPDTTRRAVAPDTSTKSYVRQLLSPEARRTARPVKLRFRCETLGASDSRRVWMYMALEVRVASENGVELAVCTTPWETASVLLPFEQDRISVRARGYRSRSVELSGCKRAEDGAAVVMLTPDATVQVVARDLSIGDGSRFGIGVGFPGKHLQVTSYHAVASSQIVRPADSRGRLRLRVPVPSGLPLQAFLRSSRQLPKNTSNLASQVRSLEPLDPGETRNCRFDLEHFHLMRGRVNGLPGEAIASQRLLVWVPDSPIPQFSISLAADASFEIRGLPNRPVRIRIKAYGGNPRLRYPGTEDAVIVPGAKPFHVLEPSARLVGVVPVEQGAIVGRPFAVAPWRIAENRLDSQIPLFTLPWFEHGTVHFRVRHTGSFTRRLQGRLPSVDGLIRVEVPAPGGEVIVRADQPLTKDWHLALGQTQADGRSNWIQPDERSTRQMIFRGVPAGEFRLVIGVSGKDAVNLTHNTFIAFVTVRSRKLTSVRIRLPRVIEAIAVLRNHEPWVREFGELQLRLECLDYDARSAFLGLPIDGQFEFLAFEGWRGLDYVTFGNKRLYPRVIVRDHDWDPARRLLVIRCPKRREPHIIESESIADGGLWLRVYKEGGERRSNGIDVLPKRSGRFELQQTEDALSVMLMENAYDPSGTPLRVVRGWLRIPTGKPQRRSFGPTGRWVTIRRSVAGVSEVGVLPPSWWRQPGYAWATRRIVGTDPQRVWMASAARGLQVDDREIAAANIRGELVIR